MEEDKTTHQFKPTSRFEDAVALYNFDIELRDLMFKAVQRLEIALRTNIIQEFSLAHGPFWFFDTSLADDTYALISANQASLEGIITKVYVKTSSGKIVEVSADENGLFVYDGEGLEDSFQFYVTGGEFGLSAYSFVPEPSACAALAGALSLVLAFYRRKK